MLQGFQAPTYELLPASLHITYGQFVYPRKSNYLSHDSDWRRSVCVQLHGFRKPKPPGMEEPRLAVKKRFYYAAESRQKNDFESGKGRDNYESSFACNDKGCNIPGCICFVPYNCARLALLCASPDPTAESSTTGQSVPVGQCFVGGACSCGSEGARMARGTDACARSRNIPSSGERTCRHESGDRATQNGIEEP